MEQHKIVKTIKVDRPQLFNYEYLYLQTCARVENSPAIILWKLYMISSWVFVFKLFSLLFSLVNKGVISLKS